MNNCLFFYFENISKYKILLYNFIYQIKNFKINKYCLCYKSEITTNKSVQDLFYKYNIHIVDINEICNSFKSYNYITSTKNICKTLIPYCMYDTNIDRILFLDLDIEIKKDIQNFFDIDCDKYEICGCIDSMYKTCIKKLEFMFQNINLKYYGDYINSGVLLYNMNKIRTVYSKLLLKNTIDSYINIRSMFLDEDVWCKDQHIVNLIYKNKKIISNMYNCTLRDCDKKYVLDCIILHYCGEDVKYLYDKIMKNNILSYL